MNQLIKYLLDNLMLDFEGDLTMEMVRDFLRADQSPEAKELLTRLVEASGPSEMLITVADCLKEHLRTGINEEVIREQLQLYTGS